MLIGFTTRTSRLMPRLICKKFKHVIILYPQGAKNNWFLLQLGVDGVFMKLLNKYEKKKLEKAGYIFVDATPSIKKMNFPMMLTCVGLAKRALGIKKPLIWTPDQLYKYLTKEKKNEKR